MLFIYKDVQQIIQLLLHEKFSIDESLIIIKLKLINNLCSFLIKNILMLIKKKEKKFNDTTTLIL